MYNENSPQGVAFARSTDPTTSQEAAKTVNVTYLEGQVYAAIQAQGARGANQDELVEILSLPSNSVTPRFKPLLKKGLVQEASARKGSSGKSQRVLVAVPGIKVVAAAQTNTAIVREANLERTLREANARLASLTEAARASLAEAQKIADKHNLTFPFDLGLGVNSYEGNKVWTCS
jgi:DNA-binding MarR family transcriptional regulator